MGSSSQVSEKDPKEEIVPDKKESRFESWDTLIKFVALFATIVGGICTFFFVKRVTLNQNQSELEHKQVQLAISIAKEEDPKVQSDMIQILKAAYTSKQVSSHVQSLISRMEENVEIAVIKDEKVQELKAEVSQLSKQKESSDQDGRIKQDSVDSLIKKLNKEISLLSSRSPITAKQNIGKDTDVLLIIGHTKQKPGLENETYNITEYAFAQNLASLLKAELELLGISSTIIGRTTFKDLPEFVNTFNYNVAISLHANAFNKKASGTEALYLYGDTLSKKLAVNLNNSISETLGIMNRRAKEITAEDRGGYLLKKANSPITVIEPIFIDNDNDYLIYRENKLKMVHSMSKTIEDFINSGS